MAEYLVTLSLLIIIVLLVRGFFRKSISPTVMYALWLVVVLRLCLPFPLFRVEMDLPAWQETIPQEQPGQQGAADPGIDPDTITPPVADTPSVPDTPSVIIPTTPVIPSVPSVPTVPAVPENPTVPGVNPTPGVPDDPVVPEEPPVPPTPIDWMRVAVTVWISGSAVLAVWFVITGIVYHYRLITHRTLYKTLRKTKVYITEDESAPCLAGVIPAIYIPPVEMDDDARAFIVLHEYMHLRHGDHVWAVVRILALIAHWWNPLVWAAVILSKRDAELACDHAVASQLNRENRMEYARILLDTIPQKHRYAVGLGSAPMKERILRLTKTQKNRILCVVLAVIITAAAVGCSFVHLTEKESPEEPPAFDFDLDTLCRHIADGDLSALDLFDASNEEFLQGQFNALHAYYSGTAEKAGGDWEAMPEGGVALPGELSFKNCEKFEYSTASQTPVVLRYDVGDYWLYAAFTLLDVGTTGDVSEILWHLSEAWFIPQSDAVEASVADLAEWKVYSYFQNVGYTEWKTLKFYNQVTGESDYFSSAAGIKITSLQYSGGKVFVECDSHGFLIFDLMGRLYECLSTNKDTYIAYKNEYGAYIPGSGRWLSDSRLQARGEKGIFTVTLFDGEYSLADASLSESEILEIWRYNVGNAQKNNNAPQYHVPYGKLLNDVGSHVLDLFVMKGQAYLEARQAYDEEAATVPWLVYMIRALDVSREEITSALQKDYVPYTDAIVDALFSEDDGRINETFHSPLAICHEGKVYTAYDLSLKITDVDSEEQKAFVRSIPKEDIIALIRAIQARDAMHGVVTPGEIVKLIYRLKDITLTAPGDEYAYGSYCYVHGMAYHSYPSALTDALDRDAFNAWHEEAQWHIRENGCPFPQSNIYEFIHHFNIPKSRFVELYNERTIDDDYPIDLLYGGTAEAVDAYYRTSDPEKELESIKWANLRELKMHINAYIRDELHIQMKTSHCSLAELMHVAGIKAEELSSYYSKGHAVSPENRYDTIFDYDPAAVGYTTDASFEKVLARYTAYYLDCAICGLTPYDTPYDRQVSEMAPDIPLSGVLSCVLRGEDAFYDTATKQRAYLTDWLKTNEMSVSKYSVIDLNGDGAPELVLWLNRGTNEHVGFLVLYDKNNTVYAHLLYYRQFNNLKEDGTFDFSSGVSNHGIGRIDFEGDTYTIRKLAYSESADNQNVSYFVDGKSVTKTAFEAYQNAQNSKPEAVWVEHSIEAAPGYKQYTPAIEIDTSNREYIMPKAMYGESWPGANFDRTANIHPGVDGVGYITFGVCSDWKSSDYVSRYYTYRVTSAGGYIISVEEAETVTRDMVLKKGKPYTGSLEGQHTCVVNQMYYGITISGDTISASVGLYQTDAGGTGKGTYTYDPKTGKMSITTIEKYHDGTGNLLVDSPKTVTGKLYEYNDMVHFLYDDAKATPLPLSFPKVNAFPPDRTDFIFDDLAGGWYHSFRDEKGDQFYCLALDPETQQICFAHGFYDGSYAARYVGTYRVDYNRIIHATLQDNNDPSAGEMKFVFSMGYSMGRDETGEMRTTINITPQVCDMENYRPMLGRYFGFQREKFTTEELDEREEHYNFVMTAYEKAAEAASWFRHASLVEAGAADGKDSIEYDGRRYYRVTKFDTYADLRQYLEELFSASLVDQLLNDQSVASYITHNGKLYATPGMVPQNIRLGKRYYSASKVTEDWYAVEVTVEVLDTKDLSTVLAYQSFQFDYKYKNGKWVFTGFPHIQ